MALVVKPALQRGPGQFPALVQEPFDPVDPQVDEVLPGGESVGLLESAAQSAAPKPETLRQLRQVEGGVDVGFEMAADRFEGGAFAGEGEGAFGHPFEEMREKRFNGSEGVRYGVFQQRFTEIEKAAVKRRIVEKERRGLRKGFERTGTKMKHPVPFESSGASFEPVGMAEGEEQHSPFPQGERTLPTEAVPGLSGTADRSQGHELVAVEPGPFPEAGLKLHFAEGEGAGADLHGVESFRWIL